MIARIADIPLLQFGHVPKVGELLEVVFAAFFVKFLKATGNVLNILASLSQLHVLQGICGSCLNGRRIAGFGGGKWRLGRHISI